MSLRAQNGEGQRVGTPRLRPLDELDRQIDPAEAQPSLGRCGDGERPRGRGPLGAGHERLQLLEARSHRRRRGLEAEERESDVLRVHEVPHPVRQTGDRRERSEPNPEALGRLVAGLLSLEAAEAARAIQDDVRRRVPGARVVERRRVPGARVVECWDFDAASVFGAVGDCRLAKAKGTLPAADKLAQARAPIDAFFDRPRIRNSSLRAATAAALVEFLQCEPGAPLQRVEAVARAVLEAPFVRVDAMASVLVASRGGDLELARALAELAVALARETPFEFEIAEVKSSATPIVLTPDEHEQNRRAAQAYAHHARGLVHLRAARLEKRGRTSCVRTS